MRERRRARAKNVVSRFSKIIASQSLSARRQRAAQKEVQQMRHEITRRNKSRSLLINGRSQRNAREYKEGDKYAIIIIQL